MAIGNGELMHGSFPEHFSLVKQKKEIQFSIFVVLRIQQKYIGIPNIVTQLIIVLYYYI